MPPHHRKVAMTQPNPSGDSTPVPQPTNPQPTAPASGPTAPTTPPAPTPASPESEDAAAERLLAAAINGDDTSQPDGLGEAGKRAIAAERERAKKAEKQLAELAKQLEALKPAADIFAQLRKAAVPEEEKTDTERLQEELAELRRTAETERLERFRVEVAAEKGLTREQAARLTGTTREELSADADALLELFPRAPEPAPAATPAPETAPTPPPQAANGPKPDPTQGARGPVDLNAQIQDALAKGDIKTSIALKRQVAAQAQTR